jgi:WD40 repeat protein
MNFLVCALTNRPTSSAVLNKRNKLTYDRRSLEEWLEQTSVCPVSKIEISKSDLVMIKPEFLTDDYVYSNGGLPYIDLLLSDHVNYLLEKKKAQDQIQILGAEIANELLEQQSCQQVMSELEQEVQRYRQEVDKLKEATNEKLQAQSWTEFKSKVSRIYTGLVEKNKSLRKGIKPNDKETIWKFKTFSTDKYLLPKKIHSCFYSNEGRYALLVDVDKKLVLIDSQKNCILDSTESEFAVNDQFDCFVVEHSDRIDVHVVQESKVWRLSFDHYVKKFMDYSERFVVEQRPIFKLWIHPANAFFVTFCRKQLIFLDANSFSTIATTRLDSDIINMAIHPDGKLLLLSLAVKPETVHFFDLFENKIMTTFVANPSPITQIEFSKDRFHFFVSQGDSTSIVDIRKLEAVYSFPSSQARSIRFNGLGNLVAVLMDDHLEVHFPKFKEILATIDLTALDPLNFDFTPTGHEVRVFCRNSVVVIKFVE